MHGFVGPWSQCVMTKSMGQKGWARTLLLQRVQELQAVQLELERLSAALVARAQLLPVRVCPRQRGRQVPRLDLPHAGEESVTQEPSTQSMCSRSC